MRQNSTALFIATLVLTILQVSAYRSPPLIFKQPPVDEQLFQENDRPFIIECDAEAEPAPEYYWLKNGKPFEWQAYGDRISQQPGRGTLVIMSPQNEDSGQYQCIAVNEWGTAISNSVFVRKAELNSFKDEHPITLTAVEGDPFKLTCQPPDGSPEPNVYWLIQNTDGRIKSINNSRMTLDPEGNLWFSNVTRNDTSNDFYYACVATSVFRNEYKLGNRVLLNVISTGASASKDKHEPEKQYVSRKNEVALRGKKIELYCIFGGTPLPQIVWNKNGQFLHPSDRITQGHYGKSLIIKHVSFEDEGQYTCEASNGVGDAKSYSINLQVLAVPFFTVEPEIINAAEDETVEFRCEASGVPEPQIRWIHNGKPIEEAPLNPRRKVNTNSIVIQKLETKDTGNYGCNATNSLGYVYKDVYLNVLAVQPEIMQPPRDEATVSGKTIRITCRVFGTPKPEVKWFRNGSELTGGRYTTLESGDLEIERVNFLDAGDYTCHASNKFGSVQASGNLVVKEHTTIIDEPEDYEVAAGSTATFRCNAITDSSLTLTIGWLRNGELIDFELEPRFVQSTDYSLTILKTTATDSGTYTCVARTELDKTEAQATLTVQDVPNPPRLVEVKCMDSVAFVRWIPLGDNRAPILRYTIQFNTSFTPDTWENIQDDVPPTDQSYNVPMTPWTDYTFRVLAWNKMGASLPSQHSEACTTPPKVDALNGTGESTVSPGEAPGYFGEDVPLQKPTNLTVVQVIRTGATTVTLSWDRFSVESISKFFRGYSVHMWREGERNKVVQAIRITENVAKIDISKFVSYGRNYVRVFAYNDRDFGPPSETLSFEMPEGIPGPVQSFNGFSLGSKGLYLVWKKPVYPNGIITGYRIYYREVQKTTLGPLLERQPHVSDPNITAIKLAKLKPNTKYRVHIRAMTSAGEGKEYFIERTTRNDEAVQPNVPVFTWKLIPTNDETVTIRVTWLPTQEGNPGSYFFVEYKSKGSRLTIVTKREYNEDYIELRGLPKGKIYTILIVAVDGKYNAVGPSLDVDTTIEVPCVDRNKTVDKTKWLKDMKESIAQMLEDQIKNASADFYEKIKENVKSLLLE